MSLLPHAPVPFLSPLKPTTAVRVRKKKRDEPYLQSASTCALVTSWATSKASKERIFELSLPHNSCPSEESLSEPLDGARFRTGSERLTSSTSSRRNLSPKIIFIESTMCSRSHVGKVQGVIVLWEPLMMNVGAVPAVAKRVRSSRHVGQQHLDTPITGPKP